MNNTTSNSNLAISGALTLNNGAAASFTLNSDSPNGTNNPLITVVGVLTVGATSTVNVAFSTGSPTGTYDLVSYGTGSSGFNGSDGTTLGNLVLNTLGLPAGYNYSLSNNVSGSQIDLIVAQAGLTWGGQNGSAWDLGTSNWYTAVPASTMFTGGTPVIFGDLPYAGASGNVTNSQITMSVVGGVSPAGVTFTNTAAGVAYQITSNDSSNDGITGSYGITLSGTGTVTLVGPNTYTGTTLLSAGVLVISNNNSIGSTSGTIAPLTFNGGTLQYAPGLTSNSPSSDISGRTVTIQSGGATIDINGNNVTYANAIGASGGGALTVASTAGGGTLALQGANTFTGLTLSGGTVNFSVLGNLGNPSTISLNGGTLQWAANAGSIDVTSGGYGLSLGSTGGTLDINGNNVSFANGISSTGAGGLTLVSSSGPATLALQGATPTPARPRSTPAHSALAVHWPAAAV